MSKSMNAVKQAIQSYLDNRAKTDELFAVAYAKPNKNIDECFNYILGEAKKQGNAVYIPDEVVFGWAVHYYDEDDIKINKLPANARVSAEATVELSEEDKEKARQIALRDYQIHCLNALKEADKAKREKQEKRKLIEATSPSLFD